MNKKALLRMTIMATVLLMVAVGSTGAAFKGHLDVDLLWRPDFQLDTIDVNGDGLEDAGDDFRYVDVEIWTTSNVPFFAVDLTCTVNPLVLQGYEWDDPGTAVDDTPQTGDDTPMVVWSNRWGNPSNDFGVIDGTVNSFNPLNGVFHFAATKLGWAGPMGGNGYDMTLLVATMRFKVQPQTLASVTSPISCKGNFVDRDGIKVATAKFNKTSNLVVQEGYTLQGTAQLQGQKSHANIRVSCAPVWGSLPPAVSTVTDSSGSWKIGGIRYLDTYDCQYYANVLDSDPLIQSDEPWLAGFSYDIPLWNDSYSLLPVELFAGNTDRTSLPGNPASESEDVGWGDFLAVTTSYGIPQLLPYANGDANGDLKVNETDLALVGGRYYEGEYVAFQHLLYDVSTDWDNKFIRYGVRSESSSSLISDGKTQNYWATMSPDGSQIAFIVYDQKTDRYVLYTGAFDKGKLKAKALTPKTFNRDAMAPSWSPDGSQIAFHCSDVWYDEGDGLERKSNWLHDSGELCLISANGSGLTTLDGTWNAHVYPPTWLDNRVLLFGANNRHWGCANSICYHDIDKGYTDPLGSFISGDAVADMPVVRTDKYGDAHFFYRYIDRAINAGAGPEGNDEIVINSRTIRYIESITYDGENFVLDSPNTITFYEDFSGPDIFTLNDVEYYNVERRAEGMSIIGYGQENYNVNDTWYGWNFFVGWFEPGSGVWDNTHWYSIDTQIGFEMMDWRGGYKCGHQPYDPYNPECPSFGLRHTAEILP